MKVEEVLSGKTVCYVMVNCLPVEKADAAVRIECVVMDTSHIGTRVCRMYVCSVCGDSPSPHSIPGVMRRSPIWDFSLYCCPYTC